MIIACPACRTRYVVPDTAIGVDGRTVRCAKCKHSWFQDGPELAARETEDQPAPEAPEPAPEPEQEETESASASDQAEPEQEPAVDDSAPADASPDEQANADAGPPPQPSVNFWRTGEQPEAQTEAAATSEGPIEDEGLADSAADDVFEEDQGVNESEPVQETVASEDAETAVDAPSVVEVENASDFDEVDESDYSQFDYEPPFKPRRNPLKLWTAAAAFFALSALGAIVAVNIWGLPSWLPIERPVFGMEQPQLQLNFPPEQQDLRTLPNGTEYLEVSGTVTNSGRETASIPSIMIALRNEQDQIIYTWEIALPQPSLAPGETITVREAMVDVPRAARFIEIGWSP